MPSHSPIRHAELIVLACVCALCGFMAFTAFGYSLSDALGPGAGFFPFWLGMLGAVLSLALLVQAWRGHAIGEGTGALLPRGEGARRAGALVAGLAGAAFEQPRPGRGAHRRHQQVGTGFMAG